MPPTLPRQDHLRASGADADDTLAAGSGLATQSTLLGDLNAIRSQLRRLIAHVSGGGNWYDDPTGVGSGVDTIANKRMTALVTGSDGDLACAVAMSRTPVAGSYVGVRVNGIEVPDVGDGSKVGVSCYFSGDGGVTARAWTTITLGDTCHWNGSVAGYELAGTDVIDFFYEER